MTYDAAFAGRTRVDEAFASHRPAPDVVLAAIDADVIKTYVEAGLGVGLVADIAYDAARDVNLVAVPAGHLFGSQITHLAIKHGATLRAYVQLHRVGRAGRRRGDDRSPGARGGARCGSRLPVVGRP